MEKKDIAKLSKAIAKEEIKKHCGEKFKANKNSACLTMRSKTVRTVEEAIEVTQVDLDKYEMQRFLINKWDCVAKLDLECGSETLAATELWQVKVWFVPKAVQTAAGEALLEKIGTKSEKIARIKIPKRRKEPRYAIEISIMDPHLGMDSYLPQCGQKWSLDLCEQFYLYAVDTLLSKARKVIEIEGGVLEEIVFPFGNDFHHCDSPSNTTTRGTPLGEAGDHYQSILRGEQLAITAVDTLAKVAPVVVLQIPGNHDEYTSYWMGRVLKARFQNNKNVTVDASCTPYKLWTFGEVMVMFEHGSSMNPVRMAALMANEWPDLWAKAKQRYIHCGDQHRKGSSKPSMFEEQGVSIDFLPGMTPVNKWHEKKSFSMQKRAAKAFIWDKEGRHNYEITIGIDQLTGEWNDPKSFEKWLNAKQ
jgi:hypothetical protein